jgi:hypothetical protein
MNFKTIKATGITFALAAAFLVAAGAANSSSASAQSWRWGDRDRDGRIDTRRELVQERMGFNAGFAEGRADAIRNRRYSPFPNRRFVSNDYRQGFHRGYAQAYRQFAFNRGHRYGRY